MKKIFPLHIVKSLPDLFVRVCAERFLCRVLVVSEDGQPVMPTTKPPTEPIDAVELSVMISFHSNFLAVKQTLPSGTFRKLISVEISTEVVTERNRSKRPLL